MSNNVQPELDRIAEIEVVLQEIFEAALAARDAAQNVLALRQSLGMRLTKMQIEIQKAQLSARE
jgi:hypothetical protein